ncbi:hypothetical protein AAFC00_003490 [Neodothiora populina]|uniref:Uncharacterized protein n=1 Tax=Neodothiora populina TaxID=2781224 RepID=A0ABR3PED9_9PEZI
MKEEVGMTVSHYEVVDSPVSLTKEDYQSSVPRSIVAQRALDKTRQTLTRKPAASSPLKGCLSV